MTNRESNEIYLITFSCLSTLGTGIYILINSNIRNADIGNDKLAFGLIIASIIPFLGSLVLVMREYRQKDSLNE